MIQENELVTLILALCVWGFFFVVRARITKLDGWKTFLLAFTAMTMGWTLTVLEGFCWPEALNFLEHACYAISSILLALWCWRALPNKVEGVR